MNTPLRRSRGASGLLPLALVPAAALCGCPESLLLPEKPSTAGPPVVEAFSPPRGYAGTLVTVTGRDLGPEPVVRFGGVVADAPVAAADGRSLKVRAPLDAETGPLSVATALGRGDSATDFVHDGPGHLRHGRVAMEEDLRLNVSRALPLQGGATARLLVRPAYQVRVYRGEDEDWALQNQLPSRIATAADGGRLVVLDVALGRTCGAVKAAGFLSVYDPPFEDPPLVRVCLPSTAQDIPIELAVDPTGTWAVVVSYARLWTVALAAGTLGAEVVSPSGAGVWDAVAWHEGSRFLVTEGTSLRPVDASAASPLLEPVELFAEYDLFSAVAVHGPTIAVGSVAGRVLLADLESGMLDEAHPGRDERVMALEISGDGETVAATFLDDTLMLFDLTEEGLPALSSMELERPGPPVAGPHGTFVVGVRGGEYVLADATGAVLERRRLSARLASARLRQGREHDGALVVDVAALGADVVLERFAEDLSAPSEQWQRAGLGAGLLAAVPGRREAFLQQGGTVRRVRHRADGTLLPDGDWSLPEDAELRRLSLLPDGAALLAFLAIDGTDRLAVADAAGDWDPPKSVLLAQEWPLEALGDGQGGLLVLTAGELVRYGVADLLSDATASPTTVAVFPGDARGLHRVGNGWLVLQGVSATYIGADASATECLYAPIETGDPSYDGLGFFSADGRHLYSIGYGGTLWGYSAPEGTCDFAQEMAALDVPGGLSQVLPLPDGRHAIAVDAVRDRLLLLE